MTWGAVAVVGASVASSYLSSKEQSKASGKATRAQIEANDRAIAEQRAQFDEIKLLLSPYVESGNTALSQQMNLLGLGTPESQKQAISNIEMSPQFQALTQQGENAILSNASATGGLRGGNTQASLAQFRPALLSNLIENQYSRLGGISQLGQASAAGQAAYGQQSAQNIGGFMGNIGQIQGQNAINQGQLNAAPYNAAMQALGFASGAKIGSFGSSPPVATF